MTGASSKVPYRLRTSLASRMLAAGLIRRRAYQRNPVRYEYVLSKRGKDLEPILEAIIVWGKRQYPGTKKFPRFRASRTKVSNDSNVTA